MSDRDVKGISPEEWMKVWHVYDAAMALWQINEDWRLDPTEDRSWTEEYRAAREAFEDACRRAKEGR